MFMADQRRPRTYEGPEAACRIQVAGVCVLVARSLTDNNRAPYPSFSYPVLTEVTSKYTNQLMELTHLIAFA